LLSLPGYGPYWKLVAVDRGSLPDVLGCAVPSRALIGDTDPAPRCKSYIGLLRAPCG
jgi:hypothetical protein